MARCYLRDLFRVEPINTFVFLEPAGYLTNPGCRMGVRWGEEEFP
ncbi:hypothetical protein BDK92_2017 [Micromonospora pisi]|uniref:Uncharacterized protein n=1 Tax=Micromonospora pisi TaxID=589240 RepID=A0A495JG15_9ACTN|nr:hypothetical protein BDK92_2017 [Micromonospora pisi]